MTLGLRLIRSLYLRGWKGRLSVVGQILGANPARGLSNRPPSIFVVLPGLSMVAKDVD